MVGGVLDSQEAVLLPYRLFFPQPLSEAQKPYRYHGYTPPPSPSANTSSPFIYSALEHTKEKTKTKGRGGVGAGQGQGAGIGVKWSIMSIPFHQRFGYRKPPWKCTLR